MRSPALIGAAGLLAYGGWVLYQRAQGQAAAAPAESPSNWLGDAGEILTNAAETAAEFVGDLGLSFNIGRMREVTGADVAHPNVQAFLRVLRRGEGTSDPDGYRRHFGGELFTSYADHPRKVITKTYSGRKLSSSAAGAYQFLTSTWDETARIMGLKDFTPASQDLGAVGRISARGALDDVKAGRFDAAIVKVAKEWASMPGSPYGQPVISLAVARNVYQLSGGSFA